MKQILKRALTLLLALSMCFSLFSTGAWAANLFKRITVSGTVNLILCKDGSLTASEGITVGSNDTLNIYGQERGAGIAPVITGNGYGVFLEGTTAGERG